MGFPLPDLIIESIIRDGFEDLRRDPEAIEDVFSPFTQAYASRKNGMEEIDKIKQIVSRRELSIVHAWGAVNSNIPCVSIQLAEDQEHRKESYLADRKANQIDIPFSTPEQLAGLVKVSDIDPIAYDSATGIVTVPDSVNLSGVHVNLLFVDASKTEHVILGGINNTLGFKQFMIDTGATVDLNAGGTINSSIDFDRYSQKSTAEVSTIVVGVHTQDPLLTKYIYVLLKYFLVSRKADLCSRGILQPTYSGSDFSRDMNYQADQVYTRFLNIQGVLHPEWRSDKVCLIDNIEVNVKVPRDKYGNDILNTEDQTVQVGETNQEDC